MPPAELYVAELAQRADVLALTFHVTYWDNLGWPDRFSLPQATQRQRGYAQALNLNSVFTPQTVIDGRSSFVGSDRQAIDRRLLAPREGPPIALSLDDNEVRIRLSFSHRATPSDVVVVAYRHSAVTSIGRGENSGRTINKVNIVRAIRTVGRWEGQEGEYRVRLDSLPQDATDVAILLQGQGQSGILGAATLVLRGAAPVARLSGAP